MSIAALARKTREKIVLEVSKESIPNIMVKTQKLKKKEKIIPEILKEDLLNQRVKIQSLLKKKNDNSRTIFRRSKNNSTNNNI